MEISIPFFSSNSRLMVLNICSKAFTGRMEGVPPPKNMVCSGILSGALSAKYVNSRHKAST